MACKSGKASTFWFAVLISLWIPKFSTVVSLPPILILPSLIVAYVVLLSLSLSCCGSVGLNVVLSRQFTLLVYVLPVLSVPFSSPKRVPPESATVVAL